MSNPHKYSETIPEINFLIADTIELIDELLNDNNMNPYENEIITNIGNINWSYLEFLNQECNADECRSSELLKSINLHSFLFRNIILNMKEGKFKKIEGGFINE